MLVDVDPKGYIEDYLAFPREAHLDSGLVVILVAVAVIIIVPLLVLGYRSRSKAKAVPLPASVVPASTLVPVAAVATQPVPEPVKEEAPPPTPELAPEPVEPSEAPTPSPPAVEPVVEIPPEVASVTAAPEPVTETAPVTPAAETPTTEKLNVHLAEPKFELFKDKSEKFRFRLKARNGEIIATGEAYNSKEGCINGIESIKKNAPTATIVELEPVVERVRSTKPRKPRTTKKTEAQ